MTYVNAMYAVRNRVFVSGPGVSCVLLAFVKVWQDKLLWQRSKTSGPSGSLTQWGVHAMGLQGIAGRGLWQDSVHLSHGSFPAASLTFQPNHLTNIWGLPWKCSNGFVFFRKKEETFQGFFLLPSPHRANIAFVFRDFPKVLSQLKYSPAPRPQW